MCLTEKCFYVDCKCVFACIFVHMPVWDRAKQRKKAEDGKARLLHAGRDDAKSTGKSVTTGPSRQSPLQETQIKVDLSSQDLFRAVPTSSLDPVAVLFLSVLRSVRRGDEALELSQSKFDREALVFLRSTRKGLCRLYVMTLKHWQIHFNYVAVYNKLFLWWCSSISC